MQNTTVGLYIKKKTEDQFDGLVGIWPAINSMR